MASGNQNEWAHGRDSKFRHILSDLRAKRSGSVNMPVDNGVLQGVKSLEQKALLESTSASMSAVKSHEMEDLALLDRLTETYNSRTFFKELKAELIRANRYKRQVSLVMVKLDGFEEVLEKTSNLTGDAILKVVANVIKGEIRDVDFPARYSKEDFAIILPETGPSGVALVAERIRYKIGVQSIIHNGLNLRISASIGIAIFPGDANNHEELVAKAVQAAQLAVQRGGDRVCSI
jgi:diguanylate cyclase (GGDEF)-like protein